MDFLQVLNFIIFLICVILATRLRLHTGYWLGFYVVLLHHAIFYGVVNLQNFGILSGIHTMGWRLAVRLHFAIVVLFYLITSTRTK